MARTKEYQRKDHNQDDEAGGAPGQTTARQSTPQLQPSEPATSHGRSRRTKVRVADGETGAMIAHQTFTLLKAMKEHDKKLASVMITAANLPASATISSARIVAQSIDRLTAAIERHTVVLSASMATGAATTNALEKQPDTNGNLSTEFFK